MKKYIYLTFVLALLSLLFMSNRRGRATTVGLGSTGAPGDDATVCQSCHNGPIDVAVQIAVLDQVDTITQYEPNKTYKIHVRINHIGGNIPKAHGFQMTLLNAAKGQTGPNLKDLSPISSNVKLVTPRNGRLYAEQTDRSDTNLFEIQWKAPAAGAGPVTIYAGGNGVNANGSDSGDGASKSSLQLNEKISSATAFGNRLDIQIYPNPFAEQFVVRGQTEGIRRIDLLNLFGQSVKTLRFSETNPTVDLGELADGIYFAKFFDQDLNLVKTQKLMKRSLRP